jgi:chromosome segregation ATPase
MAGERFSREGGKPRLAEASHADSAVDTEVEVAELLTRLEHHAAESGRLEGHAQTLERALETERDGRRRLAATLKRERKAAKALHDRAEHDRAARAAAEEDLARVRQAFTACEQQLQTSWARLIRAEQELAVRTRPLWRKLLFRTPRD